MLSYSKFRKIILNQHILSKNYTRARSLVLTHTHNYTSYQTIAKQTIKTQITSSSEPCPRPPCLLKKKILRLPDFLRPAVELCRSHALINWHRLRPMYIYINDLITLYYCYNSEAFSGIESTRARAHAP